MPKPAKDPKATADQMAQLKAQHDAAQRTITLLTSERDALSARLAALQAELKDAATRHAPPVELLPFARRVLQLSSHAGTMPPAELQASLMRLAIDRHHAGRRLRAPLRLLRPLPMPLLLLSLLPQTARRNTHHRSAPPQEQPPQNAPAPDSVSPVEDQKHDGQDGQDGSVAPAAEKNRNTAKAEAKLEKALEYLVTLNDTTAKPDKWVITLPSSLH